MPLEKFHTLLFYTAYYFVLDVFSYSYLTEDTIIRICWKIFVKLSLNSLTGGSQPLLRESQVLSKQSWSAPQKIWNPQHFMLNNEIVL